MQCYITYINDADKHIVDRTSGPLLTNADTYLFDKLGRSDGRFKLKKKKTVGPFPFDGNLFELRFGSELFFFFFLL